MIGMVCSIIRLERMSNEEQTKSVRLTTKTKGRRSFEPLYIYPHYQAMDWSAAL